jgi:hypothetical protein
LHQVSFGLEPPAEFGFKPERDVLESRRAGVTAAVRTGEAALFRTRRITRAVRGSSAKKIKWQNNKL